MHEQDENVAVKTTVPTSEKYLYYFDITIRLGNIIQL